MFPKKAHQFIAGPHLRDALARTELLNKRHVSVCISHLGEQLQSRQRVQQAVKEYKELIRRIKQKDVAACPDVKLTNLGLCFSKTLCRKNLHSLLTEAKKKDLYIWIDAEEVKFWPDTMDVFLAARKRFPNACLTVQAYLKRALKDVPKLLKVGAQLRLVKGCYPEDPRHIYKSRQDVQRSFRNIMSKLFSSKLPFALGTHDQALLNHACRMQRKYQRDMEFQFLMGLGYSLERSFHKQGYRVAEYVPYGTDWEKYYHRRLEYQQTKKGHIRNFPTFPK